MPVSKVAFVIASILLGSAAAGGILAVTIRPAAKPATLTPRAAAPAVQPQQAPPNCTGCVLPPITEVCIPKGLSYACQQCWIAKLNAAALIPNQIVPVQGGSGWGYWALRGTNPNGTPYGYTTVDVMYCP